ncbi:EMYY motif lipoprotein [Salinicoccus albus]|uniref:EMYY motif lipoprotein n=1 Tax=Salinicoccus albus TaxID=418756 RepID=UPI00036AC9D9|nr:EMYY motif lipoprotein [Salinicoccus albus]
MFQVKNKLPGILLLTCLIALAGCSSQLEQDTEQYMSNMESVHNTEEEFNSEVNALDYEYLPDELSSSNEDVDVGRLQEIRTHLEDDILPLTEQMSEDIEAVEVNNEELTELYDSYSESVEMKHKFSTQLYEYVDAYLKSEQSNEQLINLSQSFMDNQDERSNVIEAASSETETEEIDQLIEQINTNSEELDDETMLLQGDESIEEKQTHIEEVIMPLINEHIDSLNTMNLQTESAIRVRSLSLEMYYGFEKYYQERKATMMQNKKLQNLQLQNILEMTDTFEKLDENYHEQLNEIESELE